MQFLKSLVSTIASVDSASATTTSCTMTTMVFPLTTTEMEAFHHRVWQQFHLMALERQPANISMNIQDAYFGYVHRNSHNLLSEMGGCGSPTKSPKSLKLAFNNKQSPLPSSSNTLETMSSKTVQLSQFAEISSTLFELKCKLAQLEQRALSPVVPEPSYEVNLDKVSGLITGADNLLLELQRELINSQPGVVVAKAKLEQICKTLQAPFTRIEDADTALLKLSCILKQSLHECLNSMHVDSLVLLVASQLRTFWLLHYPNYLKKVTFASQIELYFENLLNALTTIMVAPYALATTVSLETIQDLLESLLPYLAVDQNYVLEGTHHKKPISAFISGQLFPSAYANYGFENIKLVTVIIRLLLKYALQAKLKPETDLAPLDYPELYASTLGKLFKKAISSLQYTFGCGSSERSRLNVALTLLELYEPFELYSGFKTTDKTLGLDAVKIFLDSLVRCQGASIWSYFTEVDRMLERKGIDPGSTALVKYLNTFYPRPAAAPKVEITNDQSTAETTNTVEAKGQKVKADETALAEAPQAKKAKVQETEEQQQSVDPMEEEEVSLVADEARECATPPSEVSLDLSIYPNILTNTCGVYYTTQSPVASSTPVATPPPPRTESPLTTKIVMRLPDESSDSDDSNDDEEPMEILDTTVTKPKVAAASGSSSQEKRTLQTRFLQRFFGEPGKSCDKRRPMSLQKQLFSSIRRRISTPPTPGSEQDPIVIDETVEGDDGGSNVSPNKKRKVSTEEGGQEPEDLSRHEKKSCEPDVIDLEVQSNAEESDSSSETTNTASEITYSVLASPARVAVIDVEEAAPVAPEPSTAAVAASPVVAPPQPPAAAATVADPTKVELIHQVNQMQRELLKSQELFAKLLARLANKPNDYH